MRTNNGSEDVARGHVFRVVREASLSARQRVNVWRQTEKRETHAVRLTRRCSCAVERNGAEYCGDAAEEAGLALGFAREGGLASAPGRPGCDEQLGRLRNPRAGDRPTHKRGVVMQTRPTVATVPRLANSQR
jgi:hypothetical protein